ncbi:cupin domain-containing protein [Methylotenera versatilis]|uniref:cupin domain-containing protein n=1 Tax=Methylotenera versatilis TaxID=1055487 RepID=UPI0006462641|nr:cupin domain-containing protein [Methylotenera versatilis]
MSHLSRIKKALFIAVFSLNYTTAVNAHDAPHEGPEVTPVMIKDLTDIPGKEVLMITVNYKPGEVEVPHRHDAHCFLYVLEGSVIMGVKGGKEVTLKAGQTFYEGPNDIHTIGRNASKTNPAKFLVLLLKNKGVDAVLPVK